MRVNIDETGCIIANCGDNNHKPCTNRTYENINSLLKQCGKAAFTNVYVLDESRSSRLERTCEDEVKRIQECVFAMEKRE